MATNLGVLRKNLKPPPCRLPGVRIRGNILSRQHVNGMNNERGTGSYTPVHMRPMQPIQQIKPSTYKTGN